MSNDPLTDLSEAKSLESLKQAFAADCQASARYAAFASRADLNGELEAAQVFRAAARGKELQAEQQLDFLRNVADPQTGAPIGTVEQDLHSALERATYEYETFYPGVARVAHEEGYDLVGSWFEAQADAARHHAAAFRRALETLQAHRDDELSGKP